MQSTQTLYPFNFPCPPYDIQIDLMNKIYETLEKKQIGIFCSPTGTGKSMSLICSTLTWLQEFKKKRKLDVEQKLNDLDLKLSKLDLEHAVDWIQQQTKKKEIENQKFDILKIKKKFEQFDLRTKQLKERKKIVLNNNKHFKNVKKLRTDDNQDLVEPKKGEEDDEENFLDYDEAESNNFKFNHKSDDEEEDENKYFKPKIIYCSRTHSQLSQFINEIRKTIFKDQVRLITLGSRSNLCVNPNVNKCKNLSILNDKCMEMQKKNHKHCEFKKQNLLNELRDEFLSCNMDIEDALETGKQLKCCSYYAERIAVEEAELLILPYNLLLHKNARESFKLDLDQSIVIIDEAHNLLDIISSINSVEINCDQLINCHSQLNQYLLKYNQRLSAINTMYIKQLIFFLNSLITFFRKLKQSCVLDVINLELECNVDQINLFNLIQFCENSQLARKLFGFVGNQFDRMSTNQENNNSSRNTLNFLQRIQDEKSVKKKKPCASKVKDENKLTNTIRVDEKEKPKSSLYLILDLIRTLTNRLQDGRYIINLDNDCFMNSSIKFILLNTSKQFDFIVKQARSIILIGGTMEPIEQFTDSLFSLNQAQEINQFSCNHIIPDENLVVCALSHGPTDVKLDFSFTSRNNKQLINELGRILINICNLVQGGIIIFFVSYDFEQKIFNHFNKNKLLNLIQQKGKKIFREPRNSSDVNIILSEYSQCIHNFRDNLTNRTSSIRNTGAVLFSVVGGKMSEGINFNDDLGRCIIMVGLPYANIKSVELKEKMNYLEQMHSKNKTNQEVKKISQDYYENLCMKAVNQSIGRAIRHRKDYASILLLDYRFCSKKSVVQSLSGWIKQRYQANHKFVDCLRTIKKFFDHKK